MTIELENVLIQSMNEGINLFLGAGFSIDSYNSDHINLPLGRALADEMSTKFNVPKLELPQVFQMIESRYKENLYNYLYHRFSVSGFDISYKKIEKLNIQNIFTTNIDNLIFKIFEDSKKYYINDTTFQGPSFRDRKAINYYPLHGCIINKNKPLVFTPMALASAFTKSSWIWDDLKKAIASTPTIFLGYSLNDPGILETLDTLKSENAERKERWIVLREPKPEEEEYFKSIGFNIIISSNKDFFEYINKSSKDDIVDTSTKKTVKELFGEDFIPSNISSLPVREITAFYLGASPIWFDIIRPDTYKTSHFKNIHNLVLSNKDTIVIGIPGSGKTTLMMQLASNIETKDYKLIFESPSIEKAKNIINNLGTEKAIIFIDNFTNDIQSFLLFHKVSNIKLIGFGREHDFEIISHYIERNEFNIHSVTDITEQDAQEIYNRLPADLRTSALNYKGHRDKYTISLFEFINKNLKFSYIYKRYKELLNELDNKDELLADFLVLSSYVHSCGTPLSFDMVSDFFYDDISSYEDIYEMKAKLGELLTDKPLSLIDEHNQDYFTPRSMILAETVMSQVPSKMLRRVLNIFLDNLPAYKIVNYKTFRKKGHDKAIIEKAFPNWEEGKSYYEQLISDDDKNPFLWQQGALYLSQKKQYNEAFIWIEKALSMSKRITSIRNSHAIILFDANINREGIEVKESLDRSMQLLKDCYFEDKRKIYHTKRFAYQSINYFNRFADDTSKEYLKEARHWLKEEIKNYYWDRELKKSLTDIEINLS